MRDEQWGQSSFGGDPIGSIRTYAPAAFEAIAQNVNLNKTLPVGWLRPKHQILLKSEYPELSELLDSVLSYTPSYISMLNFGSQSAANFGDFQNGIYVFGTVGAANHGTGIVLRSTDGSTFTGVHGGGAYFLKHTGGSNWLSSTVSAAVGLSYSYSTDNVASFTSVSLGSVLSKIVAGEFDGTNYFVFRPDNKYYKSPNIGTITAEQTGNWDKLADIFRLSTGRWLAALDRTSQGDGIGLFSSDNAFATWTKRYSLTGSIGENTFAISRIGTRLFLVDVGDRVVAYSDDQGATWSEPTVFGAYPAMWSCAFQRAPAFDGVRMVFGHMVSEDNGSTWQRWIVNPAYATPGSYGLGAVAGNPAANGSLRWAPTLGGGRTDFYALAQSFNPSTHIQIPGESSFPGIPFPIMRVK